MYHTYRVQFLKDVVLARILDNPTSNMLNSCIILNQIDIINHLQNDVRFPGEIISHAVWRYSRFLLSRTDGSPSPSRVKMAPAPGAGYAAGRA